MKWQSPAKLGDTQSYFGVMLSSNVDIGIVQRAWHGWTIFSRCNDGNCIDNLEALMGVFTNAFAGIKAAGLKPAFIDEEFASEYPTLYIFLSATEDDEGKKRTTSTLMIFIEDGMAKGCLKERDHDATLWQSAPSIVGVFAALESALNKSPVDWRKPAASKHRR